MSILEMSENYIYSKESIITVNREWLRLIHTLLLFSDNTIFWLKLDSNKIYIDHSNNNDVIVKYKNVTTWDKVVTSFFIWHV